MTKYIKKKKVRTPEPFSLQGTATIGGGASARGEMLANDGYTLLHTTGPGDPDAPWKGYYIKGNIYTLNKSKNIPKGGCIKQRLKVNYAWWDWMDPEGTYLADRVRAGWAKLTTKGQAQSYRVEIYWSSELEVKYTKGDGYYEIDRKIQENGRGWPVN